MTGVVITDHGTFAAKACEVCEGRGHAPDGDTLGDDCVRCEGTGEVADTSRPAS